MREIYTLRCEYCIKNYGDPDQCKGYEKKCLYNLNTNNCGSCRYLIRDRILKIQGVAGHLNSCLLKYDLSPVLKTDCTKYVNMNAKLDRDDITILTKKFDRRCFISYYKLNRLPLNSRFVMKDVNKVQVV